MEPRELFHRPTRKASGTNKEKKLLGIDPSLAFTPLTYGLITNAFPHNFLIKSDSLKGNTAALREGELEISLISSLAYALKKETWRIVPEICLASAGKVGHVQLFFKKGLKDIRTVAVDSSAASEETLLRILMREKFFQSPDYIYMTADLPAMLDKAEAALITGDQALTYAGRYTSRLDLNEEWVDLTGLPFVYAFWAGREFTVSADDLKNVHTSYEIGKLNLETIARNVSEAGTHTWAFYHDYLTKNLTYNFSDEEKEGLLEFYQYAFFYGYTEFIPDLHFYDP